MKARLFIVRNDMKNSSLSLKERSTRQIFAIFAASEDCDLFYSSAILFSLKWFVVSITFHIVSCDKSVCIERFVFMYKYCTKDFTKHCEACTLV